MQIADLVEHARLLGEVVPALNELHAEVQEAEGRDRQARP
ncbi:hypothetical protein SHL15_6689 [Streptomyces hygroscopicus subsp. limoneus]|nr:hypothetical protein SHL15_6689 [Streptomyces hygroscopicus subsp. limoneus]